LKAFNPQCNGNRRDKVALRTTCIHNIKFKIIKLRTGCEYVEYFYCSENLSWTAQTFNWAACGPWFGHSCLAKLASWNWTVYAL